MGLIEKAKKGDKLRFVDPMGITADVEVLEVEGTRFNLKIKEVVISDGANNKTGQELQVDSTKGEWFFCPLT